MQSDGAVVASHSLVADFTVAQARQQSGGQHKVIKPPAHILGAGVHHVGPEAVCVSLLWVQLAEAVDEAVTQQLTEALALLRGEASVLFVAFGVLQVDLLVGHVEVTAQHQGLALVQVTEVGPEVHVPGLAVVQPHQAATGVGHVSCDQEEGRELCGDDSALLVVLLFT